MIKEAIDKILSLAATEITRHMLETSYPDHHLRHNPRKKEKTDESNRG